MIFGRETPEGFKRLHCLPRRYGRYEHQGTLLEKLTITTPRQRYIRAQSEARYLRRNDAYGLTPPIVGEIGIVEGFRFVTSSEAAC